jgi:hypothetical protein
VHRRRLRGGERAARAFMYIHILLRILIKRIAAASGKEGGWYVLGGVGCCCLREKEFGQGGDGDQKSMGLVPVLAL